MQELAEAAANYVSNNQTQMVLTAAQGAATAFALRTAYYLSKDNSDYRDEAGKLTDSELATEISDLDATFKVNDYGSEVEGSWEEFMIIYDGIVRPDRNNKKEAYGEEASNRDGRIDELLVDHTPNENFPLNGVVEALTQKVR